MGARSLGDLKTGRFGLTEGQSVSKGVLISPQSIEAVGRLDWSCIMSSSKGK